MKKFSVLFLLLFASCAHGPKITDCNGDPDDSVLACSNYKGVNSTLTYPESDGFFAYPSGTYQSFLDWYQNGVAIVGAVECNSNAATEGLDCYQLSCSGTVCSKVIPSYQFIPWSQTNGYVFLSPSDDKTVKAYIGLSFP